MKETIAKFAEICESAATLGSLKSLVLHSPARKGSDRLKVKGTLKRIGDEAVLQLESHLTEGRLTHENLQLTKVSQSVEALLEEFKRADLVTEGGNASVMINKKGDKASLVKHGDLSLKKETRDGETEGNNRRKNRILKGDEPFLYQLGVSDNTGRVKDKMQAKFRQINRFCEYITEAMTRLGGEGRVTVADLCCGKSYLSFAAYHTVTAVFGRECLMYCVDLKQSVIDYCAEIAGKCGFDGMRFYCEDISRFTPEVAPDMVISLHACDIATDIVLDTAIRCRARVILSTPCCHPEMNEKMDSPNLDFIGKRPLLRQKLCSAATDALRLMRLEAAGYETDATELIDPENTPKNIMLRGYLRRRSDREKLNRAFEEYSAAYRFMYGTDPKALPID